MAIVYEEDFESGVTGWSNSLWNTSNPGFTNFLGYFQGPSATGIRTQKTYDVSGGTGPVIVTFDFYEIDDWDGDTFEIYVDGIRVSAETFSDTTDEGLLTGAVGDVSYSITSSTKPSDIGLNGDLDQIHQVTLVIQDPGASFSLGFGGIFTAGGEGFGIDNLTVTRAEVPAPVLDAIDDAITVSANETTGDIDGDVVTNDAVTAGNVAAVNGGAGNVGTPAAGSAGGLFTVNANGTFDFSANGDFEALGAGESAVTTVTYTLTEGAPDEGSQTADTRSQVGQSDQDAFFSLTTGEFTSDGTTTISGSINLTDISQPNFNLVFVMDVSGSTDDGVNTFPNVGDLNLDGQANDIIDGEIAGFRQLSDEIDALGFSDDDVDIGFVTFSSSATLVGTYEAGSAALDTALGNVTVGGNTSFDAALQQALNFFSNQGATTSDVNVVYFLSDGIHNGGNFTDEVADLETLYNARIQAVGIGNGASLSQLNQMDNTGGAQLVNTLPLLSAELQDPFSDAEVVDFRVFVDGVQDLSFDVSDLTQTVLGYDINAQTLGGLTTTAGESSIIVAEIVFDDDGDGIGDTILRNTLSVLNVQPEIDTATLSVTVTGENDGPDAVADGATVGEDDTAATVIDVLANDTDPDANDVLGILSIDTTGTVGSATINDNGTPGDLTDDTVSYDPNGAFESLGAGETAIDTFTYTVTDGNGGTDTATVSVTVTGANDGPNAVADGATDTGRGRRRRDGHRRVTGERRTDPDANDVLGILSIDTTGTVGSATINDNGTPGDLTDDTVSYDPNGAFESLGAGETAIDTFTYTVTDGNGGTDTATVSVTVTGANDGPNAVADGGDRGRGRHRAVRR